MPENTSTDPAAKAAELQAAKDRLVAALKQKEIDKEAIEAAFWRTVDAEIRSGALRQVDVVAALGVTRETVRKQIKKYTDK
ncbi:hypothetical protein AB0O31_32960 [Kitasatospora cineracea]|uniref:hypothetical protein n=1 Tax=Kitasatospora cineracea TaxID=88074 RepID=UPI0034240478